MRSLSIAVFTAFIALTGCQDYNVVVQEPSRLEILLNDFQVSPVYKDLQNMGFRLNQDEARLVEITHFEYLFLGAKDHFTYVVKYVPVEGWKHFMKIKSDVGESTISNLSGTIEFDFYSEGVSSIHNFEDGVQTEYYVFSESQPRRVIPMGRTMRLEDCNSMCHTLDCAGRKFEEKSWIGKLLCAENIVICMGTIIVDCLDEGCSNSHVKSCNHH